MNYWTIIGMVVTGIGLMISIVGTFQQQKQDSQYQAEIKEWRVKSEEYLQVQSQLDRPDLKMLSVTQKQDKYVVVVRNVGKRHAEKVKFKFKEHSLPLATSQVISLEELPVGTVWPVTFDVFLMGKMIMNMPDNGEGVKETKEAFRNFVREFKSGKKTLRIVFYLTYSMGDKEYVSPDYFILGVPGGIFGAGAL